MADAERERLRYLQLKARAGETGAPEVIQEMHPAVSSWDRAVVKNFGSNPEAMMGYLQKKYPDLEVTASPKGEILLRGKGESSYKVLDPDTGFFSKDFLNDAGDVVTDIGQGIATTAAQAAAGVAGASAGGIGAIPAAMGAGAAVEGLGETARQGIGEALGIDNNMDLGNVGISTASGALSPLLFGTGASSKAVMNQALKQGAQKGLPKYVALQEAKKAVASQSGLPMRGLKAVAPKVGEFLSGVDANTLKTYANNFDEISRLEKTGVTDLAEKTGRDFTQGLKAERMRVGKELGDTIRNSGQEIDIRGAKDSIRGKITELESKSMGTPAEVAQIDELKNLYKQFFQMEKEVAEEAPEQMIRLGADGVPLPSEPAERVVKKVVEDIPDALDAEQALELQMRLKDPANLSRAGQNSPVARNAGKDLASQQFENVASDAVRDISSTIDDTLEAQFLSKLAEVPNSPRALKSDYQRLSKYGNKFKNRFSDADQSYRTMSSLDAPSNAVLGEMVQNVDKNLGLETLDNARKIQAHKVFNNPSWLAISSKGSVNTARSAGSGAIGGLAGYTLGRNLGESDNYSGAVGAGIGTALGGFGGGPRAIRFYLNLINKAGKLADTPLGRAGRYSWLPALDAAKSRKAQKEQTIDFEEGSTITPRRK